MQYRYIGRCAKGEVVFQTKDGAVVMPFGEAVEVPEHLANKLKANTHFEAVECDATAPKRRGRPPKSAESQDSDPQE